MKHTDLFDAKHRGISGLLRSVVFTFGVLMFALLLPTDTAWGRGKPPPPPPPPTPNPDIVYMSLGSRSVRPNVEIRGETPSSEVDGFTDSSLVKAATNRDQSSIAWSPDGSRFAWLENGAIMIASPGKAPSVLYSTTAGDGKPVANGEGDALAWGPDCRGGSALAFKSYQPYGIYFIWIDSFGVAHVPEQLVVIKSNGGLQGMAFSPRGRHLAVAGWGDAFAYSGVNLVPMCGIDHTPTLLVAGTVLVGASGSMNVPSMDWSRWGERLAVSMTTSDDPNYPWRDLKIIDLNYTGTSTSETVSYSNIWIVNLDYMFGAASSEHSPQWGPSVENASCQRIAFSQSAGVSDGSDSNGRHLYLLDIYAGSLGGCAINDPFLLDSKNPRALDWK